MCVCVCVCVCFVSEQYFSKFILNNLRAQLSLLD